MKPRDILNYGGHGVEAAAVAVRMGARVLVRSWTRLSDELQLAIGGLGQRASCS
jgi:hypothetical protein